MLTIAQVAFSLARGNYPGYPIQDHTVSSLGLGLKLMNFEKSIFPCLTIADMVIVNSDLSKDDQQ